MFTVYINDEHLNHSCMVCLNISITFIAFIYVSVHHFLYLRFGQRSLFILNFIP